MKFQWCILFAVGCLVPVSFIAAPYPDELVLQHVPTVLGILGLAVAMPWIRFSSVSFACVIGFLLLHIFGARWLYTFVPYDAWAVALTGTSLSDRFGWERNHYDRLVHLASGLLGVPPAAELLRRFGRMRPCGAAVTAVAWVLAIGAVYEVFEWQIAVTLAPEHAEAYNGQQGDVWDPQKDLALAWLGAAVAACLVIGKTSASDARD